MDTFCGHFFLRLYVETFSVFFSELFLWTLFGTLFRHFLKTLFVETFLGTINCSAIIMVKREHNEKHNLFSSKKNLI